MALRVRGRTTPHAHPDDYDDNGEIFRLAAADPRLNINQRRTLT